MKFRFALANCVLLLTFNIALSAELDLAPKIPPGYEPIDPETEKGLWMELEEYETAIQRSALLIKDESIDSYVKSAACRVARDYCDDLRIYIIRNPGFNASMTANGTMVVWTGLLVRVSSEDELAAVLGHELAHYTQLHSLARLHKIRESMTTGSILDLGIILVTGVSIPAGQLSAISNAMAFSRDQEEEADLLGVKFMSQSGYDPHAAAQVWETIVEEEKSAAAKREEPGMFSRTHPNSETRINTLKSFVTETYPQLSAGSQNSRSHVDILNHNYMWLMEDQIDTNRFGRTENILRKHRELGVNPSLIHFFQGEMYRQRNTEGDLELAKESYQLSLQGKTPLPDAYRNLGYINLKQGNPSIARDQFSHYLDLKPDADDRAMIEFYILE
jgi:hypothetical protein